MGGSCCCALCLVLPLLWLTITLLYQAVYNYTPSCSIHDFYIPALDTRLPISNSATFIFFDLQLDNKIEWDNVRYEFINPGVAFYYGPNMIANYSVPRFSQGDDKTTHLRDLVETRGMPWSDAFAAGFTGAFAVEFVATVKVHRVLWITGYKQLSLRADFEVNDSGLKIQSKDIKLNPFSNTLTPLHSDDASTSGYSS